MAYCEYNYFCGVNGTFTLSKSEREKKIVKSFEVNQKVHEKYNINKKKARLSSLRKYVPGLKIRMLRMFILGKHIDYKANTSISTNQSRKL